MSVEQLTRTVWMSGAAVTMEQARLIAEAIVNKETRDRKQVRVLRAEETR